MSLQVSVSIGNLIFLCAVSGDQAVSPLIILRICW